MELALDITKDLVIDDTRYRWNVYTYANFHPTHDKTSQNFSFREIEDIDLPEARFLYSLFEDIDGLIGLSDVNERLETLDLDKFSHLEAVQINLYWWLFSKSEAAIVSRDDAFLAIKHGLCIEIVLNMLRRPDYSWFRNHESWFMEAMYKYALQGDIACLTHLGRHFNDSEPEKARWFWLQAYRCGYTASYSHWNYMHTFQQGTVEYVRAMVKILPDSNGYLSELVGRQLSYTMSYEVGRIMHLSLPLKIRYDGQEAMMKLELYQRVQKDCTLEIKMWSMLGRRLGVCRDIITHISQMLWNARPFSPLKECECHCHCHLKRRLVG